MELTQTVGQALKNLRNQQKEITKNRCGDDLTNEEIYDQHRRLFIECADYCLEPQGKQFVIDDYNRQILRFLLLYFNGCRAAEEIFPDKEYKITNNILLCGKVGIGKTLLMQSFAKYLEVTGNPRAFQNLSVTQMINYYKLHNHIDGYTFNESIKNQKPINICLNDIGLQTHQYFGTDTKVMICEFLYARNDIWQQLGRFAHVTTNLSPKELKDYFDDSYGRIIDRFKNYNIIHLDGESRRL